MKAKDCTHGMLMWQFTNMCLKTETDVQLTFSFVVCFFDSVSYWKLRKGDKNIMKGNKFYPTISATFIHWVNSQVDKLEALRINWSDLRITADASHSRWQTEHLQVMFLSTQRPFEITKKIFLKLCNHRYKKWKTEFMG